MLTVGIQISHCNHTMHRNRRRYNEYVTRIQTKAAKKHRLRFLWYLDIQTDNNKLDIPEILLRGAAC